MKKIKELEFARKGLAFIVSTALVASLSSAIIFAEDNTAGDGTDVNTPQTEVGTDEITTALEQEATTVEPSTTASDNTETTTEATAETTTETTTAEETTTAVVKDNSPAVGDLITVGCYVYKVTGTNTVTLKGFANDVYKTRVVVFNTISYNGVTYKVTKVGNSAFKGQTNIKKVTIRKNVTDIGKSAFYGCTKLTTVTIRTGVTIIRKNAFSGCKKLSTVNITSTVLKTVKTNAFKNIKSGAVINVMTTKVKSVIKTVAPSTVKINRM